MPSEMSSILLSRNIAQGSLNRFWSGVKTCSNRQIIKSTFILRIMKRANLLIRKADRDGLADLGFSDETIANLFKTDFAGRVGFPNYALTNNSANIRRLEKRLAILQKAQSDETTEEQFPCRIRLIDNVEDNRLSDLFS